METQLNISCRLNKKKEILNLMSREIRRRRWWNWNLNCPEVA